MRNRFILDYIINKHLKDPATLWKNLKLNILPPKSETDLPFQVSSADDMNRHFLDLPECNNDVSMVM